MTKKTTFADWLKLRINDDTIVGDLARDVVGPPSDLDKAKTPQSLQQNMLHKRAQHAALEALTEAACGWRIDNGENPLREPANAVVEALEQIDEYQLEEVSSD